MVQDLSVEWAMSYLRVMNSAFCRTFIFTGFKRKCHEDAWITLLKWSVKDSFIIQYENRIHPAASDYTFTDYTPVVGFSHVQVQRSDKHNMCNKTSVFLQSCDSKLNENIGLSLPDAYVELIFTYNCNQAEDFTHTHTSWNSSNDFCGVKTFNKLMIWKREEHTDSELLQGTGTHTGNDPDEGHCWERDRVDRRSEVEQKTGDEWMRGKGLGEE